jgi:hypothetical protein
VSGTRVSSPGVTGAAPRGAPDGSADDWVPPDGLLEELDGSPIMPSSVGPSPGAPGIPWRRGIAAAATLTARRPRLWAFALVAFLARGGLVALALPIVVLPTFIGLANFVGPASVSAEGPGPRVVALIALGLGAGLVVIAAGTLVAAAAEVALHRATAAAPEAAAIHAAPRDAGTDHGPTETGAGLAVVRVTVLRLLLLLPVAAAAAVAVPAWIAVAYRELTLPSDVAAPLVTRVLGGAPAASFAVLGTWLAAEVVGGFAARRAALLGASVPRALAGGLLDPLRAPLATTLTVAAALATSLLLLAPAWLAVGAAWDAARHVVAGGTDLLAALGGALLLAAAWLAALLLAALAAGWRATLVTMELLRRRR